MFVKYLIMREYYTNKFEEEMNYQRRLYDKYQRDQNFSYHYDYNRTGTRLQRPVTSKSIKPASANKTKSSEKTTSSSNHKKSSSNKIEPKTQKTVPKPASNSVLRRATSVQAISKLDEQKQVNKQITNNPLPNSTSLGSVSLISSRRRAAEKPAKKVLSPIRAMSTSPENSVKQSEPPRIVEHIQRSVSARPQPLKPILNSESNKSFNKIGLDGFRSAFSKPIEKTVSFEPKHTKRYIPRLTNKSPNREKETKNQKTKKSSKPTESFDKKNSGLSKTPSFKSVFANPEPKASIKRSESKKQHSHKDKDTHKHSSSSSKNKPSRHKPVIISENKQIKILVPLAGKLLRNNTLNPLNFGPNSYLNSYNQINPYLNAMQYLSNQQQAQPYQNINQFYNGYMNNHSFTNIAENNYSYSPTPSHHSDVNWSPQMDYYY